LNRAFIAKSLPTFCVLIRAFQVIMSRVNSAIRREIPPKETNFDNSVISLSNASFGNRFA